MKKIVFLGDSVTKGVGYGGVADVDTFARKVGLSCGYLAENIINAGVSSDTSAGALARLQNDVISKNPDVCVLMLGHNDYENGVSVATYIANMAQIITQLLNANIQPVILNCVLMRGTNQYIDGFRTYIEALENLAKTFDIGLVDILREYAYGYLYLYQAGWTFQGLYVDTVHQTIGGHQFLANICLRDKNKGFFNVE